MTTQITRPPDSGRDDEAIIKRARRRQRRRRAATGVAVAAMLAGGLGVFAHVHGADRQRQASPRPGDNPSAAVQLPGPIPTSVDTAVLMWPVGYPAFGPTGGPPAYFDNLRTGRLSRTQTPAIAAGDYQPLLITVGRWLVYVGDGTTAIRDDLTGRPRVVGTTPLFAPSARPGRIWLEHLPRGGGAERLRSVSITGGSSGRLVTLPKGARLVEGTDAGLLLQDRQGDLELWTRGAAPRTLPRSPLWSDGFDASGQMVAYGTGCVDHVTARSSTFEPNAGYDTCRMLQALNVVTGKLRSYPAPPGTAGWVPNGFGPVSAISPDGSMIAAYAATRPLGHGRTRLYALSLTGGHRPPTAVPSSAAFLFARTGWSARGSWLLYQGPDTRMWAYRSRTGTVRSSKTPCCQYTVMATFKSPAN
jgi:hypothetical protein